MFGESWGGQRFWSSAKHPIDIRGESVQRVMVGVLHVEELGGHRNAYHRT